MVDKNSSSFCLKTGRATSDIFRIDCGRTLNRFAALVKSQFSKKNIFYEPKFSKKKVVFENGIYSSFLENFFFSSPHEDGFLSSHPLIQGDPKLAPPLREKVPDDLVLI